ncbi:Na+/H+ antiporter [Actinomadura sp. NTSP31]|uniref:Na+/H+ antiporter n=1 Tax=Actinomadura sp. NTSP31 TaxID=1735447 RepID=UPI0035C252F1
MFGLELVVVLGAAILVCAVVASRLRVAQPVLLLIAGLLLGFIPTLRQAQLPPAVVLLLFLPPLLYWESLTTSPREIRKYIRGIALTGTVLVVVTAGAVAVTAHALGLPWGPAWVLGAAIAPTDATAVGVLGGMLPRQNITILRAESLVNDGTALVIYGLAVGITVGEEQLSVPHVGRLFLLAYLGGTLIGAVIAWLGVQVRRRLTDPLLGSTTMLLIPFTAYLLAETVGASGVLAVVVCGLIMSQTGPRIGRADARLQTIESYALATFLLNGALFVLVGIEVQTAVRGLTSDRLAHALLTVAVVFAVLVAARFAFLFGSAYLIRLLDRRPKQRLLRVSNRSRVVSGIAGFRGAVSLAAALGVPTTLSSGAPFPDRDLIIFVTSGVIVATLVVQGLLLPGVVRWARFPRDTGIDAERRLAETTATQAALDALPDVAGELDVDPEAVDRLRRDYETHLLILNADDASADDDAAATARIDHDYNALRLALIDRKRATVLQLRDQRRIDDTVLRQIQARLDIEELRLSHRPTAE